MTAKVEYQGGFRCTATHVQSDSRVETDAPVDNRGKGERFSPTDSVCLALATCILTTMAIKATDLSIELKGTRAEVLKHMIPDPRRIGKIDVDVYFPPSLSLTDKDRDILERTGNNCPVAKSLHPDLVQQLHYHW